MKTHPKNRRFSVPLLKERDIGRVETCAICAHIYITLSNKENSELVTINSILSKHLYLLNSSSLSRLDVSEVQPLIEGLHYVKVIRSEVGTLIL